MTFIGAGIGEVAIFNKKSRFKDFLLESALAPHY